MKCGACNGDGRAYSCGAPVRCSTCNGSGTAPEAPRWLGDPDSDPDRPSRRPATLSPDLAPDYPGLTDEDGAMVAFMVRCKQDQHGGPYLPAYLAGWFLAACRAPSPNGDLGQFRDSIRGGYADCQERQARRVQYQARPVECERIAVASDLLYSARGYDDAGDPGMASIFRQRAARVMAGKHREEPE